MNLDPLHNSDSGCDCEDCAAAHAASQAERLDLTRFWCACKARKMYHATACERCMTEMALDILGVEDEGRTTPIPVETIDTIRVTDPLRKFNQEDNR